MEENVPQLTGDYQVGSRVGGYLLEEQIGLGGMAVVFRARDDRLGRQVALKILAPALAADEAFRHRFIRESRMAAAVDDPHIIPVYEAGNADGALFIAMRYVGGGDVRSLLNREGTLNPERVASIISPVASALDTAHAAGLVHRDVKPANLLLDVRPGRPDHVYLSDFGLSKEALGATGLTAANQFLGTIDYAAPEQVSGKAVGGPADQYALGCAAFEMLSGEPPFRRDLPIAVLYAHLSEPPPKISSCRRELPAALDQVFDRVLAKSPSDRYPTCAAFTTALRQATGLTPYDTAGRADRPPTEVARPAPYEPPPTEPAARMPWAAAQQPPPPDPGPTPQARAQQPLPPDPEPSPWAAARQTPPPGPGQYSPGGQPFIPGINPQYGPADDAPRQRRWPLIALAAIGTAAVVAIAYGLIVLADHSATSTALTGNSPSAIISTSPAPATSTPSPEVRSPSVSPTPSVVSPATGGQGTLYTDPEGFSVELPPGWAYSSATRTGTSYPEVHFAGPTAGFDLEISWSKITGPSALGSWRQLDAMHAQNDSSYQRIALHQVAYRGYDAALWEFTELNNGVPTRYFDWGFVVKPGVLGFAILLDGPEADWQPVYSSVWNGILSSFKPPN